MVKKGHVKNKSHILENWIMWHRLQYVL